MSALERAILLVHSDHFAAMRPDLLVVLVPQNLADPLVVLAVSFDGLQENFVLLLTKERLPVLRNIAVLEFFRSLLLSLLFNF